MQSLEAREARLQAQLEALQRELAELQSGAVARLGPAMVARAQELESAAAKCRQVGVGRVGGAGRGGGGYSSTVMSLLLGSGGTPPPTRAPQ